ncbi:MAG: hypothetical protein HYV07_07650 [Deltaproteobacteria bacterium]|nr:hypothetical protein [Deltaproteobacteria bacterium]
MVIVVSGGTELDELGAAAKRLGLRFKKRKGAFGSYYDLGRVGDHDTIAVKSEMGSLGYKGSASKAVWYREVVGAQSLLLLGAGFGTRVGGQRMGDVIVSTAVWPYDSRRVIERSSPRAAKRPYRIDYSKTKLHPARPQLLARFRDEVRDRAERAFGVHFGILLSGGAHIQSAAYRRRLLETVPASADLVVGGDMEAVGLIAASPPDDPSWIVVKGISDFAESKISEEMRKTACRNAADLALAALINAASERVEDEGSDDRT